VASGLAPFWAGVVFFKRVNITWLSRRQKKYFKKTQKKFGQFQKRHYLCTALRNKGVSVSAIGV